LRAATHAREPENLREDWVGGAGRLMHGPHGGMGQEDEGGGFGRCHSAPMPAHDKGWLPVSHFSVNGEKQPLWQVDPRQLQLGKVLAENMSAKSSVWEGVYSEGETGIMHDVAVKKWQAARSPEELNQIHRELSVTFMASSRCHNVCKVFGWCHDSDGAVCVVMKRYQQNLCSRLQACPGGRLALDEVQKYGRQICMAVAELHSQGVVVADLKPQNLLIDEYDNCVVADFGISTILTHGKEHELADGLYGTFNYMSPEAFDPETYGGVTRETDAWSFGCCVVEMVSGKRPWDGTSMSAICFKVCSGGKPTVPKCLPRRVREALSACFSHERAERPSFNNLFSVFDEAWDNPAPPPSDEEVEALRARVHALEGDNERLQRERAAWDFERAEMRAEGRKTVQAEAQRVSMQADLDKSRVELDKARADKASTHAEKATLQAELAKARAVSQQLQDQLHLLLASLKQEQEAKSNRSTRGSHDSRHSQHSEGSCGSCSRKKELMEEMEKNLISCNEALAHTLKQKEVAKELLRQEGEKSRQLQAQAQQRSATAQYTSHVLRQLLVDVADARLEATQALGAERRRELAAECQRVAQEVVVTARPASVVMPEAPPRGLPQHRVEPADSVLEPKVVASQYPFDHWDKAMSSSSSDGCYRSLSSAQSQATTPLLQSVNRAWDAARAERDLC